MMTIKEKRSKYLNIAVHVLCWAIFICAPFLFASLRNEVVDFSRFWDSVIFSLPFIVVFYANFLFLTDRFLIKSKNVLYFILINLVLIVVCVAIFHQLHLLLTPEPQPQLQPDQTIPPPEGDRGNGRHGGPFLGDIFIHQSVSLILVGALGVAMRITSYWFKKQVEIETYKKEKIEAELQNLKMQLNPHFLFNSLNNIYSLAAIDGEKTQYFIHSLSQLLRYELYKSNAETVPLAEDIAFVISYCDLMQLRYDKNVKVKITNEIPEGCSLSIAPLLFISLAENAFKHGINPDGMSEISISFCIFDEHSIKCVVKNTNFPRISDGANDSGVGLENLRKRLEYLYAGRYFFQTKVIGKYHYAVLSIQL